MSIFEFLMVLVSIIIGLGVAEVLTGITRMIRSRETIQTYWIHSLFIVIILTALLQQWWELWGVRDITSWTFPALIMMLAGPIGLFMIANLLFPEPMRGADLRAYYYDKMAPVLWIGVATIIVSVTFRPVVFGNTLLALDNLSSFLIAAILVSLTLTRSSWFHGLMVSLVLVGILADVLLVTFKLG